MRINNSYSNMKLPLCALLASMPSIGTTASNIASHDADVLPNILVVVCEDISPYLGCYGDEVAQTPNLDKFATQAIRHTNMYTCVGVSSPSRYSLITGRYPSGDGANYMRSNYFNKKFGVVAPTGVKCYTEYLRKKGYYCTNNAKTDYQFPAPLYAWDEQGTKAHWKHAPKDKPFLSIFNLNITHESQIWKNTDKPLAVSPNDVVLPPYYPDTKTVRHDHAVLYTNIKKMDEQFQKLLTELEDSPRAKNTVVIFYSDNGGPLPRGKREIKDSGTLVPFMIRFPDGKGAGTLNTNLNMFVDIPATIMSIADIEPTKQMHGRAMYGQYKHQKTRKYVYGATDRFDEQVEKRASIRSKRYLYIRNYMPQQSIYRPNAFRLAMPMMQEMVKLYSENKLNKAQSLWFTSPTCEEELYDCFADPHQVHNLAYDKKFSSQLKRMRKAYRKYWIKPYNKDWESQPEEFFIKKMWPEGKKPVCEKPILRTENSKLYIDNDLTIYSAVYRLSGAKKWTLYTTPISTESGETIEVRLERIGYSPSTSTK